MKAVISIARGGRVDLSDQDYIHVQEAVKAVLLEQGFDLGGEKWDVSCLKRFSNWVTNPDSTLNIALPFEDSKFVAEHAKAANAIEGTVGKLSAYGMVGVSFSLEGHEALSGNIEIQRKIVTAVRNVLQDEGITVQFQNYGPGVRLENSGFSPAPRL